MTWQTETLIWRWTISSQKQTSKNKYVKKRQRPRNGKHSPKGKRSVGLNVVQQALLIRQSIRGGLFCLVRKRLWLDEFTSLTFFRDYSSMGFSQNLETYLFRLAEAFPFQAFYPPTNSMFLSLVLILKEAKFEIHNECPICSPGSLPLISPQPWWRCITVSTLCWLVGVQHSDSHYFM